MDLDQALLRGGVVPDAVSYTVALELGQEALDTVVLIATYHTAICLLLNTYDVSPNQ